MQTFDIVEDIFQDYPTQPLQLDQRLSQLGFSNRYLLMDKFESLRDLRVHVDIFGTISINGKVIKIAIEYQGPQHYSFENFLAINRPKDENRGIYRSGDYYRAQWEKLLERDSAKVELFKELKEDGYYLIVVDCRIPSNRISDFILKEFIRQTGLIPDQTNLSDWL